MKTIITIFLACAFSISTFANTKAENQTFVRLDKNQEGLIVFSMCKSERPNVCTVFGDQKDYSRLQLEALQIKLGAIKGVKLGVGLAIPASLITITSSVGLTIIQMLMVNVGVLYATAIQWGVYIGGTSFVVWISSGNPSTLYEYSGAQLADSLFIQKQQNALKSVLTYGIISGVDQVHLEEALASLN